MAVSHKDWELPDTQIWLVETNIHCGLDWPIWTGIQTSYILSWKKLHTRIQKYWLFSYNIVSCNDGAQKPWWKKRKEDQQTFVD